MTIADVQPQTTSRSTRGRVPVYAFMKDGEPFELTVQSATVTLGEGTHDQAVVKVTSAELEDTDGLVDSVISFRWGATPRAETFTGYIMDVQEDKAQGSTTSLSFTMSVLGPTKAMFEGTPKFWSNKSIPSALRDLAAKNQLGYTGHDHSYLWSALAQTRESDWATAVSFAKRIGWLIFNRYGVVMCYDPVRLYNESGVYTRLVMGSTNSNLEADRVLLDFQPVEESEVLTSNLGRRFGYFTSNLDAQVATQPGDFRGYIFGSDVVVRDQTDAKVYADSANVDMDRWQQYAVARIWGDSDIYPGMCVEIVSTNKQYLKAKYDGKWLVRNAAHQMDRQQYQTMLSLARPPLAATLTAVSNGLSNGVSYRPFWLEPGNQGRSRPTLSIDRTTTVSPIEQPVSVLNSKKSMPRWSSSWSERNLMSVL